MSFFAIRRLWFCGLLVAAVTGCGGGGGTANPPIPLSSTPPAAPRPTPSPYPSADGATFSYSGTLTQTFTRFATTAPSPPPGATPEPTGTPWSSTAATSVSQSVTIHANAKYQTRSGLLDYETQETDAGQHAATTVDTHTYMTIAPDASRVNGTNVSQVGAQSTDSNGVQIDTSYQSDVIDQLPQIPGAQWNNNAAHTTTESDPGGGQSTATYASDGSYTGSSTFSGGNQPANILEYPDGSGDYTMPLFGGDASEITISPVANNQINVAVKMVVAGQVFGGALDAWYPNVPPVLANDAYVDADEVALPSGCSVPRSFGTRATRIDEKRLRLDTIFGELERYTQSSYVIPPYGAVCVVAHDDLQYFYDFSGQTPSALWFDSVPVQETVTDETLVLQKTSLSASTARRTASTGAVAVSGVPSFANIQLRNAKQHLLAVRHIANALGKKK